MAKKKVTPEVPTITCQNEAEQTAYDLFLGNIPFTQAKGLTDHRLTVFAYSDAYRKSVTKGKQNTYKDGFLEGRVYSHQFTRLSDAQNFAEKYKDARFVGYTFSSNQPALEDTINRPCPSKDVYRVFLFPVFLSSKAIKVCLKTEGF